MAGKTRIAIASDRSGFTLKKAVKEYLDVGMT